MITQPKLSGEPWAGQQAINQVQDQLATWLRERELDIDLSGDGFHTLEDRDLLVVHHREAGAKQFRARLVERNRTGLWRVELTVHAPDRGEGWLLLDATADKNRFVAVPRVAKYLLKAMSLYDGSDLPLTETVRVVTKDQIEEFADAVTGFERNGVMFVAGTDDRLPFDPFVGHVGRWTRQTSGQAASVVLDPHATRAFAEIVESTHAVEPWTLRTYLPDVDPAIPSDALRHRFLTTRRLGAAPDSEVERLLGRIARSHAAGRPLPGNVGRVLRTLARVENASIVEAISVPAAVPPQPKPLDPAPTSADLTPAEVAEAPVAEQAASYLAAVDLVKATLGVEALDPEVLRELARRARTPLDPEALDRVTKQLTVQQERIDELEAELESLRSALSTEELEHALTDDDRTRQEDVILWLRRRLKELRDWEGAASAPPAEQITHYPASYLELLDRIAALEDGGVYFSGDAKQCRELDAYDSLGKTTRVAWEALLVLRDYVTAKRDGVWSHGVEEYLHRTPDGYRTMSPRKHAQTETSETMQRYGKERVFRVPPECDPAGPVTMTAHFKLGRIGMISPRLYYYDDVPRSGRVYVGYIGPHLTNTKTN